MRRLSSRLACAILLGLAGSGSWAETLISAGAARVEISPREPVPLMGYAARASQPANGKVAQPIYARAVALGEGRELTVLLAVENCILPGAITEALRQHLAQTFAVLPERVAVLVTHTHSAPCLTGAAPNIFGTDLTPEQQSAIDRYTKVFTEALFQVSAEAIANRRSATIAWGKGEANFAKNRRTAGGPVDHELPVLAIRSPEGELRALLISYACHCTTLGGDFDAVHGDWAGVAAHELERAFPQATALVVIGCGADANPHPRGTLELTQQHGAEIARQTRKVLETAMRPLACAPGAAVKTIDLPFDTPFSREQWQERSRTAGIVGYHARKWLARLDQGTTPPAVLRYSVQAWNFGDDLAMIFLPGEVVVDYALRLKRELDAKRLWINAYANEVPCYIPSERILREGGYEAELSLWYYDRPQRLAPACENAIVEAVRQIVPASFRPGAP